MNGSANSSCMTMIACRAVIEPGCRAVAWKPKRVAIRSG